MPPLNKNGNQEIAAAPVMMLTAPAPIGGLESAVAALSAGLVNAGQPVIVVQMLTPDGKGATAFEALSEQGVEIVTVRHDARDYRGALANLRHLLEKHRPAIVHAHGPRADLLLSLTQSAKARSVSTVHGFVYAGLRGALAYQIHLLCLRRFSRVIAVSEALAQQLGPRLRGSQVRVLPNAVTVSSPLSREDARGRLGLLAGAPVVGWVGRLSAEKNPFLFIEALAQVDPDVHGVVVGDGPLHESAVQLAASLGIGQRCHFAGSVANAGSLFRAFDLFVLSSDTEGTPMTVLEAFQLGTPVVATAVGGVPALLGSDAGWLVQPGDVGRLASAINVAIRDENGRQHRAARAADRAAAQFGLPKWIADHRALYAEISPLPASSSL